MKTSTNITINPSTSTESVKSNSKKRSSKKAAEKAVAPSIPTPVFQQIKVAFSKAGEARKTYKFNALTKMQESKDFANAKYAEGYKVEYYKVDAFDAPSEKAANALRDILLTQGYVKANVLYSKKYQTWQAWGDSQPKVADGRDPKTVKSNSKTTTKKSSSKKAAPKKQSKTERLAVPAVGASEELNLNSLAKIVAVQGEQIANLTKVVAALAQTIAAKKN